MRILVTGTSGQVGSAVLPALEEFGTTISADRAALDLALIEEIPDALNHFAPDLIINAAAYTAVDQAEDDYGLAFRVNAEAPASIANWAAKRNVPLIHFSTDYVFNGSGTRPWNEDDVPDPLSVYGASKLAGEHAVRNACGPHLIIRTSWVYAAQGKNFLRTVARLAATQSKLTVVLDQIGAPTSAALIADSLVGIIRASQTDLSEAFQRASGVVHLAASGDTSWHGFADAIVLGLKQRGVALAVESIVPISTSGFPCKAHRPSNSRLDLGRLRSVFGVSTPLWKVALDRELDRLAPEILKNMRR